MKALSRDKRNQLVIVRSETVTIRETKQVAGQC